MKRKFIILSLIVLLGMGVTYAISNGIDGNSSKDQGVCFWNGLAYMPGETWEVVKDGVTYIYVCQEDGSIVSKVL